MKLSCLILLAFCGLAVGDTYPEFTTGSDLIVNSEPIRQEMAPFYGEVPTTVIQVSKTGIFIEQFSAQKILDLSPNFSRLSTIPEYTVPAAIQLTVNEIEKSTLVLAPRNLAEVSKLLPENIVVKYKNISEIPPVIRPDVFSVRFEFDWNKPYGQWMNQLLKDIKNAKEAGDDEKYKTLTKQYEVWADKYLLKGLPTRVME